MKENLTPLFASLVAFCLSLLLASASQIALLTNVVLIVFFKLYKFKEINIISDYPKRLRTA